MQETNNMTKLRIERVLRGWSLQYVADAVGVKLHALQSWETRRSEPGVSSAIRLAEFYKTTVESLFCDI